MFNPFASNSPVHTTSGHAHAGPSSPPHTHSLSNPISNPMDVPFINFADGDLIIQTTKASRTHQFRVYRGILTLHSVVFRDMFTNPAMDWLYLQRDEATGTSMLLLEDDPADLDRFLKAIYDRRYFQPSPLPHPYSLLHSVLSLSTKYGSQALRTDAIHALHRYFPTTIQDWDSARPVVPFGQLLGLAVKTVRLGRATGVRSILPAALLRCVLVYPLEDVFGGGGLATTGQGGRVNTPPSDGGIAEDSNTNSGGDDDARPMLNDAEKVVLMRGFHALLQAQTTATFRYLLSDRDPASLISSSSPTAPRSSSLSRRRSSSITSRSSGSSPGMDAPLPAGCTTPAACTSIRLLGLRQRTSTPLVFAGFERFGIFYEGINHYNDNDDPDAGPGGMCSSCLNACERIHEEGRAAIWKELPGYFGLGTWEEILHAEAREAVRSMV